MIYTYFVNNRNGWTGKIQMIKWARDKYDVMTDGMTANYIIFKCSKLSDNYQAPPLLIIMFNMSVETNFPQIKNTIIYCSYSPVIHLNLPLPPSTKQ